MQKKKLSKKLELFLIFLKIGAFTFGGGYAMIPIIEREVVEKRSWISGDDILEIIAIAESTPGPIAINSATFVGSRVAGFWGSVVATLGIVIPSFVVIAAISTVLREFSHIKVIQYAFFGIRAGVLALLIKALFTMAKKTPKNIISWVVAALAFIFATFFDINILFIIIGCAIIGLVYFLIAKRRAAK